MSQKNINNITYCELDKTNHKSMSILVHHLQKKLNVNPKEYYDKFIRMETDGICPICKSDSKFISIGMGYTKYCSNKCKLNDPVLNKQRRQNSIKTTLEKYGVDHISKIDGFGDKVKQTKLERYGDENYTNSEKMKRTCLEKYGKNTCTGTDNYNEKYKKTCLEKYGVEYHTQSEDVKEKNKSTCLERYGVEYSLQSEEVKEKGKQTCLEKYGVEYSLQSEEIRNKGKQTCLEKYGAEHPLQSEEIKHKQQQTNIIRYGGITPTKNKEVINKIKNTNLERYGVNNTFNLIQTKNTFLEKYGVTNPSQIPEVKEKIKNTCIEKYSNITFFGSEYATNKIKETCLKKYGINCILSLPYIREKSKETSMIKYGVPYPMQCEKIYRKVMMANSRVYRLKEYLTSFGNMLWYQSNSELEFIKLCEERNIFIINGPVIDYTINNKKHVYFVDFQIEDNSGIRLIEIKRRYQWWYQGLKSGVIREKSKAAIKYSKENGYLPYKILFENKI